MESSGRSRQEKDPAPGGDFPTGEEGTNGALSLRPLERKILLSALLILAGLALAGRMGMLSGAAIGGFIAYGNFFLIRKILEKAFLGRNKIKKWFILQYVLKFLVLVAVVYAVVRSDRIDVLGFVLGFSSLFLGVLLEGLARSFKTD